MYSTIQYNVSIILSPSPAVNSQIVGVGAYFVGVTMMCDK